MILVTRADVGAAAWARQVRDGVLVPLASGVGRPVDIPDSPGLRALAIAPLVPAHTALTGTAALWVRGMAVELPPMPWHVVGERGLHRTVGAHLAFHSGVTAALAPTMQGRRIATVPRACLDALRWEDLAGALVQVRALIRDGSVTTRDLRAALAYDPANGAGFRKVESSVAALAAVT
ncbi:hypothetical protein [Demequina pelophila]|uniref:hypothetical protein n=1 Tax=Demequina pelophila TaxID=1638984 RepID=UPI000782934A|nr:hypothetical protein [Demequina pelophila]